MTKPTDANVQVQQQAHSPGPLGEATTQARGMSPALPQAEFIWKVHPYTNEYIRFADTKAAAVIAWSAALIGMLFSLKAHHRFMQGMIFSNVDWCATLLGAASLLAFLLLAFAVGAAFWCIKPSLWSREDSNSHDKGFINWEQVRAHDDAGAFRAALAQQSPEQLMAHCAEHVYVLAGIAKRKYVWVDRSVRLTILGSLFAGIVALFAQ